ncbi:hydrogenase expression/formation protein HypE [Helicobacter monodelphidis]|uniref:hydrogenase expression/formation protein HypE n=1 Tax=Helicobacter sp. 15-1451 TaxID=2004995 RepID=UPI000DCC8D61|nr:hydrogenase expression/formation protein HypE [Helicobacter sp. 15-1451]RAX58947.1 hydrogenase expression/formation protein HypE [Helicobacter sp. 15-1451]
MQRISLAEGSGGVESQKLLNEVFSKYLGEFLLFMGEDGGIIQAKENLAVSSDGFTISPLFFPGGDIGKLSVCGSLNDVVMMGAKPQYLTCCFLIEEGFLKKDLERILKSMAVELRSAGVKILSGDTKVLNKGSLDRIFITTTAFGEIQYKNLSAKNLQPTDKIIFTGEAGSHGALIYALREEIALQSSLKSDCQQLYPFFAPLFMNETLQLRCLRDATRGGIAAVLNEWAISSKVSILIEREKIAYAQEALGIVSFLGALELLEFANEGAAVVGVAAEDAKQVVEMLRGAGAKDAQIIGEVQKSQHLGEVIIVEKGGGKRFLEYPSGEILPRIC